MNERKFCSKEQVWKAKEVDTLEYLTRTYGMTFHSSGREWLHKSQQYGKIVVYPDRRGWSDYTRDLQGCSALDWVIKAEGRRFVEAVEILTGENAEHIPVYKKAAAGTVCEKPKEIELPPKVSGRFDRVAAYLTRTRCIDSDVVSWCFGRKILYEDEKHNCVFLGLDEEGKVRYASKRSTYTLMKPGQKPYKGECRGSDKSYGFVMEGSCREHIYVFEAPIDAMSHATLCNIKSRQFGEEHPEQAFLKATRIALGGVADKALVRFLDSHPEVKKITLCLDNDEAGITAAQKMTERFSADYEVSTYTIPKRLGKDYNELLQGYTALHTTPVKQRSR